MSTLDFMELMIKGAVALAFYAGLILGIRRAIKRRVSEGGKVNERT